MYNIKINYAINVNVLEIEAIINVFITFQVFYFNAISKVTKKL